MGDRNVFMYWVGTDFKLINILRNLIYLHSKSGKGYTVHLITEKNLTTYLSDIPPRFHSLLCAQQADYVRVEVLYKYGGIWLDADTLVMESLDPLFEILEIRSGFFVLENNSTLCNGVFGSRAQTPLMTEWYARIHDTVSTSHTRLAWTALGSAELERMFSTHPDLYADYTILNGLDTIYPVNWNNCVREFLEKPADNYTSIIRPFQPLIVLVNSVYKAVESLSIKDIFTGNNPLAYFLQKSYEALPVHDYDFVEIGTSNFDTLIQSAPESARGISVECIKYYLDQLPNKRNVRKMNVGISDVSGTMDVYYIPEEVILSNGLPDWFKGCNKVGEYHPLHIKHNLTHLCRRDTITVITPCDLLSMNSVRNIGFFKIATEGHDCIIMKALYSYIKYLPISFYPTRIQFETNSNTPAEIVTHTIDLFRELGYAVVHRGYDTTLHFVCA